MVIQFLLPAVKDFLRYLLAQACIELMPSVSL
jgi:hypothetical protein